MAPGVTFNLYKILHIHKQIIISIILLAALFFSSCENHDYIDEGKYALSETTSEATFSDDSFPTIEETVLTDQNGLKVTAKKLFYDIERGWALSLYVENNTGYDISIQPSHLAVNHNTSFVQENSDILFEHPKSGESINCTLYLNLPDYWNKFGMTTISDIELDFTIIREQYSPSGKVTSTHLFNTESVELHTSAYETNVQHATLADAQEIYSQDNICINAKCIRENNSEINLLLLVENSSDTMLILSDLGAWIDDTSITRDTYIFVFRAGANQTGLYMATIPKTAYGGDDFSSVNELSVKIKISKLDEYWNKIGDSQKTDMLTIPIT